MPGYTISAEVLGPFIAKNNKDEIRSMNGVRELWPTEEDLQLSDLPNGVFGFTRSVQVEFKDFDQLKLVKDPSRRSVEVHKTSQGKVIFVVYVSKADATKLLSPTLDGALRVIVQFKPYKEYDQIVGIPASHLVEWNHRHGSEFGIFADVLVR